MIDVFSLKNKKILITGASSGIGRETAIVCDQLGADLILTGRNSSKLNETFDLLQNKSHKKIALDFKNPESIDLLLSEIDSLDGIVNCSGILNTIPFKFTTNDKIREVFDINFFSPFELTQKIVRSKKINAGASIVFVSSISGVTKIANGISAYSATKGAISATIKVLALELSTRKIRVNAVCPGMVVTEMNNNNESLTNDQLKEDELKNYPLGYGKPAQVASTISFMLSDASNWITGTNLIIDGGASIV